MSTQLIDVIVTQEEPEKTLFIGAEVVTNASAVDAVRNILSTVEVSMLSPIVASRKSFTNFSEAETGGGKVVSKKHLNPDEVEAVPESMEKEATESHDDQKAMEVGSPVPGPSKKVKSSKDDSTEDKADTRPRPTTQTKVIDTIALKMILQQLQLQLRPRLYQVQMTKLTRIKKLQREQPELTRERTLSLKILKGCDSLKTDCDDIILMR